MAIPFWLLGLQVGVHALFHITVVHPLFCKHTLLSSRTQTCANNIAYVVYDVVQIQHPISFLASGIPAQQSTQWHTYLILIYCG